MSENRLKFCLDTNSFVEPARRFYPFDFADSYWEWLASVGGITWTSVVAVYEEMTEGSYRDELRRWIERHSDFFVALDAEGWEALREVNEYVIQNYDPGKADEFLTRPNNRDNADPYVIALARAKNLTVVTFEVHTGNIHTTRDPRHGKYNTKVKIPDVCRALGVRYVNLFDMLRFHGVKLQIISG